LGGVEHPAVPQDHVGSGGPSHHFSVQLPRVPLGRGMPIVGMGWIGTAIPQPLPVGIGQYITLFTRSEPVGS
jgi:hypothetical protein